MTLSQLLAPMPVEQFLAEYHDRQPLHLKGDPAKFAAVFSWRQINRLLDMTHAWSSHSLQLVLDGKPIPGEQYCTSATGRDGNAQLMQPVTERVREWVEKGASIVMNDVDSLTPGLASVSHAIESAGLGKAQANVYISWQSHKAFPAHYDTHDVWAVQVEGEKTWNIWEGRADWPISHPLWRSQDQAHHEQHKGKLRAKILMKPGDLLYLPRGWYHDALAEAPASVHVAYGAHAPNGLDVMNILMERVLYETPFRQPLPRQDGSAAAKFALTQRAGQLGARIAELAKDPKVMGVLEKFVADYRFHRGGNDLLAWRGMAAPAAAEEGGESAAFRIVAGGARPVRRGTEWVLKTASGSLPLTPIEAEAAQWLLARPDITEAELQRAHPGTDAAALLAKLRDAALLVGT
jgi:ribosomal protein L16 Arg81 hydroxylase